MPANCGSGPGDRPLSPAAPCLHVGPAQLGAHRRRQPHPAASHSRRAARPGPSCRGGCPFAPRCDYVDRRMPAPNVRHWSPSSDDRFSACIHHDRLAHASGGGRMTSAEHTTDLPSSVPDTYHDLTPRRCFWKLTICTRPFRYRGRCSTAAAQARVGRARAQRRQPLGTPRRNAGHRGRVRLRQVDAGPLHRASPRCGLRRDHL